MASSGFRGPMLHGERKGLSQHIAKVVSLGRRNATVPEAYSAIDQKAEEDSGRLEQHVVDFETINSETAGEHFKDKDVFFCALGTTRGAAGSAAAFKHVDYDYVVNCAKVAKEANVPHMSYVSSQGAASSSFFLYLKTKGEVEDALKEMHFPKTSIFRPGFMDRGSKLRFLEKIALWVAPSISVANVAKGIVADAENSARSKKNEGAQEETPSAVTYGSNAEILALFSTS
ncbi:protein HTATIP2-like isoform X2 [Oculina patagonica]